MDPRMMRQWLADQAKKAQITEAQIQRKRLGITEDNNQKPPPEVDNTPHLLKRPEPQYKDGFNPATDSYVSNEPTWKKQHGGYIQGQGPLSPEELDRDWFVPDRPAAPGYVPPKDKDKKDESAPKKQTQEPFSKKYENRMVDALKYGEMSPEEFVQAYIDVTSEVEPYIPPPDALKRASYNILNGIQHDVPDFKPEPKVGIIRNLLDTIKEGIAPRIPNRKTTQSSQQSLNYTGSRRDVMTQSPYNSIPTQNKETQNEEPDYISDLDPRKEIMIQPPFFKSQSPQQPNTPQQQPDLSIDQRYPLRTAPRPYHPWEPEGRWLSENSTPTTTGRNPYLKEGVVTNNPLFNNLQQRIKPQRTSDMTGYSSQSGVGPQYGGPGAGQSNQKPEPEQKSPCQQKCGNISNPSEYDACVSQCGAEQRRNSPVAGEVTRTLARGKARERDFAERHAARNPYLAEGLVQQAEANSKAGMHATAASTPNFTPQASKASPCEECKKQHPKTAETDCKKVCGSKKPITEQLSPHEERIAKRMKPALANMIDQYGEEKGTKVFYGTVRNLAKKGNK